MAIVCQLFLRLKWLSRIYDFHYITSSFLTGTFNSCSEIIRKCRRGVSQIFLPMGMVTRFFQQKSVIFIKKRDCPAKIMTSGHHTHGSENDAKKSKNNTTNRKLMPRSQNITPKGQTPGFLVPQSRELKSRSRKLKPRS